MGEILTPPKRVDPLDFSYGLAARGFKLMIVAHDTRTGVKAGRWLQSVVPYQTDLGFRRDYAEAVAEAERSIRFELETRYSTLMGRPPEPANDAG